MTVNVMVAILTLLVTGYLLYKLLTSPIRSLKLIVKLAFILLLGCIAWLGVFYFLLV